MNSERKQINEMTSFELMKVLAQFMSLFETFPSSFSPQEASLIRAGVQNRINAVQAHIDEKARVQHQALHIQICEDIVASIKDNKSIEIKFFKGSTAIEATRDTIFLRGREFKYCPECGEALNYEDILTLEQEEINTPSEEGAFVKK